jgi:hypothetical protein
MPQELFCKIKDFESLNFLDKASISGVKYFILFYRLNKYSLKSVSSSKCIFFFILP